MDAPRPEPAGPPGAGRGRRDAPHYPSDAPTVVGMGPPLRRSAHPFLDPPRGADEIGRLGPYRVLGELGVGGMGIVFKAEDPQLKRLVALKVLLPEFAAHPPSRKRFVREAQAQARVEHDRVVPIFLVGQVNGVWFIKMPLLRGETLEAALKHDPRPPLGEVVRIGRQVAEGLAAAHEAGLIHRDIKPGNVWLAGSRRRIKILDFGLAREVVRSPAPGEPVTLAGAVVGTPYYMSPEQARGEAVDHRCDLFSLGVVLYQMATGRLPFGGPWPAAVMAAITSADPVPPAELAPGLPPALADLILRLLAKDPADRPPTAQAVLDELWQIELELARDLVAVPAVPADPAPAGQPDPSTEFDFLATDEVVRRPKPVRRTSPVGRSWPVWVIVGLLALTAAGLLLAKLAR